MQDGKVQERKTEVMENTFIQENKIITDEMLEKFKGILVYDEKRIHTIEKYMRDIRKLKAFLSGRALSKERMIEYKAYLEECGKYTVSSINSFLTVANCFCEKMGWHEIHVKAIKIQQQTFETEDKEITVKEYEKLVKTAWKEKKARLALVIQTIASTGIRISELQYITAESLLKGSADVNNKGKVRRIMYPKELIKVLKEYAKKQGIKSGSIFITCHGNPLDRSNVWRDMKKLGRKAGVPDNKVFPHNMRHLFARSFYNQQKDLALLGDVLGHSNISTTRIYIKSTGKEHQKMLDRMKMVIISGEIYRKCQM